MWVVSAALIGKAAPHREFSYFSPTLHREGAVARLPARGKSAFGIVMKCRPLRDVRQQVRSAGFGLKKITSESRRLFTQPFLRAAFDIADFHACSVGAVLADIAPKAILEYEADLPEAVFETKTLSRALEAEKNLIAPRGQRLEAYAELAREQSDRGASTLIIAPTVAEAVRVFEKYGQGTEAVLLHGELPKKKMIEAWQRAAGGGRLLIVATPFGLSAPRRDWGAIILERAGARSFTRNERPFLSILECAWSLARRTGAELYLGSSAPLASFEAERVGANRRAAVRAKRKVPSIIDMRPPKTPEKMHPVKRAPFSLFSPAALTLLEDAPEKGEGVLLICARHGFAAHTVCDDCGETLSCKTCGAFLILEASRKGERFFVCRRCGFKESARTLCRNCGSWRLTALGVGAERVHAETSALFPGRPIFFADEASLRSRTKTAHIVGEFYANRGAILISTEGVLPYISSLANAIVVSADSLLFIPEYSALEQALQFLTELQGLVSGTLLIQTRAPEHALMQALASGDTGRFSAEDLSLRQKLSYPPFTTLIHLALEAPEKKFEEAFASLQNKLQEYRPVVITPLQAARSVRRQSLLIRLPRENWPEEKLLALLRGMPPAVKIRVNPNSLF